MDLLQLKYVVAIAEAESMTQAAEQLHISQSALSLSYKRLEEELGVKLFRREGRKLQLTESGQHFCNKATEILKKVSALEQDMHRWQENEEQTIVYSSEAGDFSNEAKMLFNTFFPELQLMELRDNAKETLRMVKNSNVPFALTCYDLSDEDLVSELLIDEPMYAFVGELSPLAQFQTLSMEQFEGKPLITQRADFSISRVMVSFFETLGLSIGRRHYVNDPESMALTVYNGLGNTFIPETVVNLWKRSPFAMAPGTKMIPVEDDFCRRKVYLTWHRTAPKTPVTLQYMEYLRHFGKLAQRLHDVPNPMEMEAYMQKYYPDFCRDGHNGTPPNFVGREAARLIPSKDDPGVK